MKLGQRRTRRAPGYLDGQFLVAMPNMADERFARAVIYLCAHSEEGAMGIIVNKKAGEVKFPDILVQLGVMAADDAIRLPERAAGIGVLRGGPVETGRGFVLHTPDYFAESATLPIDEGVCLTHTMDVLKAIANGEGPERAVLALGYAGWSAGQLESEIQRNDWLHCRAPMDLIFDRDLDTKYSFAMRTIGVDITKLSGQAGRA